MNGVILQGHILEVLKADTHKGMGAAGRESSELGAERSGIKNR